MSAKNANDDDDDDTEIYLVLRNVKTIISERANPMEFTQIEVTDKSSHLCAKAGQWQPFIMFGCHEQRRNMTPARSERATANNGRA